jgi:hypothetical protein
VSAIFNKVWTMNSIAFCYLHSCYHCVLRRMTRVTAEDKLAFISAWGAGYEAHRACAQVNRHGRASSTRSIASGNGWHHR